MVGAPLIATTLQSCGTALYFAETVKNGNTLTVRKAEFVLIKKDKTINRSHVFVKTAELDYPICLQKTGEDNYSALLMSCTHRACELNFGGGIFSCPCHGSEFSNAGQVLEGPADKNLASFKTTTDHENIYILLS